MIPGIFPITSRYIPGLDPGSNREFSVNIPVFLFVI